jgi:molybdopterin molybdotransferase
MISVEEAIQRVEKAFTPLAAEQVSLVDALGRTLAEDLRARRSQPPVAVSAMDGYAVRAADVQKLPAKLKIIGHVPAGASFSGEVGPGEAVRIFTGAPVPAGADTIVIQENTQGGKRDVTVVDGKAPPGRYVRPAGLDFAEGEVLIEAGKVLTARDIGLAAGMNIPWLRVTRKPRIALLSTGDEIVMPGESIGPNQIVSSNGLALASFVRAQGGEPLDLGIALDSEESLRAMAKGAKGADLLVTTGGASVGEHDLVQKVLGKEGLEVDFWKIAMRPGKPLIFGRLGATPLLGLPGNSVSAMVCAVIYLGTALRRMLGVAEKKRPAATAILAVPLPENDERQDYLRATLEYDEHGRLTARPFQAQDSSMFSRLAHADCLVVRAPHAPAAKAGIQVTIIPLGGGTIGI